MASEKQLSDAFALIGIDEKQLKNTEQKKFDNYKNYYWREHLNLDLLRLCFCKSNVYLAMVAAGDTEDQASNYSENSETGYVYKLAVELLKLTIFNGIGSDGRDLGVKSMQFGSNQHCESTIIQYASMEEVWKWTVARIQWLQNQVKKV